MKKYILAVLSVTLVLVSCKVSKVDNLNLSKRIFNGKIVFEVVTKIKNEEKFSRELNAYVKEEDSIYRANHPNDSIWSNVNAPTLRLILDPREDARNSNSYYKPFIYTYEYSDTLVSYNYSKYKVIINTLTQEYRKYDLRTNKIVQTKEYKFFTSEHPYKEIIYKDSTKVIDGYNCYKVLIVEKSTDETLTGVNTYKEMYVTVAIKSLYHPIQIRKRLLEKYYPLEIKIYSDFLK